MKFRAIITPTPEPYEVQGFCPAPHVVLGLTLPHRGGGEEARFRMDTKLIRKIIHFLPLTTILGIVKI